MESYRLRRKMLLIGHVYFSNSKNYTTANSLQRFQTIKDLFLTIINKFNK